MPLENFGRDGQSQQWDPFSHHPRPGNDAKLEDGAFCSKPAIVPDVHVSFLFCILQSPASKSIVKEPFNQDMADLEQQQHETFEDESDGTLTPLALSRTVTKASDGEANDLILCETALQRRQRREQQGKPYDIIIANVV